MTLKAVLFDMDGTLVDSESMHFACWSQVLAPFNVNYEEGEFCQRFSGRPTLEAASEIKQQHNLSVSSDYLADEKYRLFAQYVKTNLPALMPFAEQALIAVKSSGLKMALVTGSARHEAEPILKGLGFYDLFDAVVTKDDVINPKPAGDPYLLALKQINVAAKDAIAVEDTFTGVTAANNAAVSVVAIANSHTQNHDFSQASYRMDDLQEFWQWLQSQL
ncbi:MULTISPECIES: HAD family phosphatase [unclassified Pseudoalteromonas]|mgnify:FL=1|jgi:HAD superfamily hydrolase (TIGR01509 family)|uniref:HAD family hydrolase n=1 Tax=Pseudoalteromonas TaxID=53246 RepID=UPI0015FAAAC4|nr:MULTISPECIES: HAD family phosphatase [unclassified Pseudoalteromonas]MBB1371518.1 HAD family phosphatase [Pseudoalteromonas sp. SR45-4]MBH0093084.1 HAD family phosphatase [Pseudoalteromonas sp. SCQQ13]MBO7925514.1 HAD family phosphatase [Pseudoalteromonas sp. K222D]|tara:strand:+ start:1951 stop:2607 length:657 start_codon:yes stop_codon:yes gene_type:complete